MLWHELVGRRGRRVRHYRNNLYPRQMQGHFYGSDLHYEERQGSGIFNLPIDTRPERVTIPEFDGWRVSAAGWHYSLGQPTDKGTDGWVGFGGRQGEHWLLSRLVRVGYLHWTSRTWTDVGGAPTYDRANLSQAQGYNDVGPEGETERIYTSASATWANLWTFGTGHVGITWRVGGDGLKEDVHIDAAAREWIAANAPPLSPPTQTWFGFIFRLDLSDIPKWVKDGVEQDYDGDFEATSGVEIRNALDQVLAFLPLSHVLASDGSAELRKRLWLDGDGNHYLLIGVRCDTLAALPPGDLDFDPSVTLYAETSDGYVSGNDASWSTLRTKPTGYEAVSNVSYFERTNEARCDAGPQYYIKRGFFVFDTATLGDTCTISAATLSIAGYSYNESSVSVQKGTQGDTLDTGDLSSFSGSLYDYVSSWALGSYNDFTLDAQGLSDISKTGNTYYCTREYAHDYSDSAPAEGFAYRCGCYFSEETGTTYDPRLVVTYSDNVVMLGADNNSGTDPWNSFGYTLTITAGRHLVACFAADATVSWAQMRTRTSDYTYYEANDTANANQNLYGDYWAGQTFQCSTAHTFEFISTYFYCIGRPAGNLNLELYAVSGGLPTGSPLATGSIPASIIPNDASTHLTAISVSSPYSLSADTPYAAVWSCPDGDASNYVQLRIDTTNNYANGQLCTSDNGGSSWSGVSGSDARFWEGPGMCTTFFPWKRISNAGNVETEIWVCAGYQSQTGVGIETYLAGSYDKAIALYEVEGLLPAPVDQTASATGTSTTPSSGATSTTSQSAEVLVGAIGTEGPPADAAGIWDGDTDDYTQRDGSASAGDAAITIASATKRVYSTGTYTASKTGITSRDWGAAIVTLMEAGLAVVESETISVTTTPTVYVEKVITLDASPANPSMWRRGVRIV